MAKKKAVPQVYLDLSDPERTKDVFAVLDQFRQSVVQGDPQELGAFFAALTATTGVIEVTEDDEDDKGAEDEG